MSSRLETEVSLYFTEDAETYDVDPLEWWQQNEDCYLTMAQLAAWEILAVPETAVLAEHVCSVSCRIGGEQVALLSVAREC